MYYGAIITATTLESGYDPNLDHWDDDVLDFDGTGYFQSVDEDDGVVLTGRSFCFHSENIRTASDHVLRVLDEMYPDAKPPMAFDGFHYPTNSKYGFGPPYFTTETHWISVVLLEGSNSLKESDNLETV